MQNVLKLEELAMFLGGVFAFNYLDFEWWWFPVLLFLPDIGMMGYLFGNRIGAIVYNVFHHKGIAVAFGIIGVMLPNEILQLIGIILFSHASLDRMLGYGLKYSKGFKYTHLGKIGK